MTDDRHRVRVDLDGHVAHVQLDRGDKHNGLDPAMFDALVAAGDRLRDDPELKAARAVVLSGRGPSFCAGLDFKAFMAGGPDTQAKLLDRPADAIGNLAQRIAWIWTEVPMPVVAAIHGACVGGGLQLALAADIRIASRDAKLSVREIEYGLIPDMSISQTLSRLVRIDVAKELTYTGRTLPATEAMELGLVTRLADDPLAEAMTLAQSIATRSPDAIRAAKRLWNEAPILPPGPGLALETELQMPLLGSKNQIEAVQARFMRRDPEFDDPA
jgi:enoyl-CoA hydratase/carnithine racemase